MQQRERLAGQRVHSRAKQGIDWPADQRGRSRNQRRVGGLGAALDNGNAAAHSVRHGTRGVLLTSPAELLAENVLHAPHRRAHEAGLAPPC